MPITIYILNIKENGHEIPTIYKKNFRDIRISLISYFVDLGRNEEDIPIDYGEFITYCSKAESANIRIRIDELVTTSDPDDPIYKHRVL
jgi:hypothetical protein